jgi:hypothetical protein
MSKFGNVPQTPEISKDTLEITRKEKIPPKEFLETLKKISLEAENKDKNLFPQDAKILSCTNDKLYDETDHLLALYALAQKPGEDKKFRVYFDKQWSMEYPYMELKKL